jgi:hypothetical protein
MSPPGNGRARLASGLQDDLGSPTRSTPPQPSYDGLEQAIDNAARDWWFQGAMVAIRQLALTGRGFTPDHLLDMVGAPTDPHYLGAVFAAAQRLKIVEAVGSRIGRDGRLVRVWWGLPT